MNAIIQYIFLLLLLINLYVFLLDYIAGWIAEFPAYINPDKKSLQVQTPDIPSKVRQ